MRNFLKLSFLFLMYVVPFVYVSAQDCKKIYQDGIDLMGKKQYESAITKFRAATDCDTNLSTDCNAKIAECTNLMQQARNATGGNFRLSKTNVSFSANGGEQSINVNGGRNWSVYCPADWCSVVKNGNSSLSIQCLKPNETIHSRNTVIEVRNGNDTKTIEVTQEAAEEFLRISASELAFSSRGNEEEITIFANTNWEFSNIPYWCETTRQGDKLKIKAKPNNTNKERLGRILINTPGKEVVIQLIQNMGNELLNASKNSLSYSYMGGKETIEIYTDSENWEIGDFPKWCMVTKVNDYTLAIECLENTTTKQRSETILVRTNKQTLGVKVQQDRGYSSNLTSGSSYSGKMKEKDVAFGIMVGMNVPSFLTDVSGDYLGSAINYGYGGDLEEPSYSSKVGFTIGVVADIKMMNHFYFQPGLYYTNIKVKNKFSGSYTDEMEQTSTTYVKGDAYDDFEENYSLNYLEIPLIFSYRFNLNNSTNLQLNVGPYIGYGLSGKCKINGSTDWPNLVEYYYSNNRQTDNSYLMNAEINGKVDLFGKKGNVTTQYTTGEMPVYEDEYKFKDSPFKRINAGISIGAGVEFKGLNVGISYDFGLTNIANDDFWSSERMPISGYVGHERMEKYKHRINKFQLKIGYIFR